MALVALAPITLTAVAVAGIAGLGYVAGQLVRWRRPDTARLAAVAAAGAYAGLWAAVLAGAAVLAWIVVPALLAGPIVVTGPLLFGVTVGAALAYAYHRS